MKKVTLKEVKKGEYFTLKPIEEPTYRQVYVRDDYDRVTKKYTYYNFADVNRYGEKKGTTCVYIDFTF